MKLNSEYLVKSILKNKVHLGNPKINDGLKDFISGFLKKENKSVFNLLKQINQIRKVKFLLKAIKRKRRPILFFGINSFKFDNDSKFEVLSLNRSIFNLCFSLSGSKKEKIKNLITEYYSHSYVDNNLFEENLYDDLQIFDLNIRKLVNQKEVYLNGYFFDGWDEGSFSNYHFLKKDLYSPNIEKPDKETLNKLKNLNSLSKVLNVSNKRHRPGAAIFFSQKGYDHVFKEFTKLGIPTICIVNSNESLKNIDIPLLGDNSCINVINFYQGIIEESLKPKKNEKTFKSINNAKTITLKK